MTQPTNALREARTDTTSKDTVPVESTSTTETAEALQKAGRLAEAEALYRAELAIRPDNARVLSNYGGLLVSIGSLNIACNLLLHAVALAPDFADAWSNLGNALQQMQRYDEAIEAYSRCLRLTPTHPHALSNLGVALDNRGQHTLAQTVHRAAIELAPDNPENRTNFALSLLASGDYPAGFAEYEWRWHVKTTGPHGVPGPQWDGAPFPGKTLLIHIEGGFGDMLQFARFIPQAKARGGRVVLRLRPELVTLLARSVEPDLIVLEKDPLPAYDLQIPVLSLPFALGTTIDTIPFPDGFLIPDPQKVAVWQKRLTEDAQHLGRTDRPFRIGLVWAGAPHRGILDAAFVDTRRSTSLDTLAPLASAAPNAVFYSLQIGDAAVQAASPPPSMTLIDHTAGLHSFDETAALIKELDLVIAVDTSTAHVAAGLGKPTWMLSRYDQCWRWMSGRRDTPWYSSLRIYQQAKPLDWSEPLHTMTADLRQFVAQEMPLATALS